MTTTTNEKAVADIGRLDPWNFTACGISPKTARSASPLSGTDLKVSNAAGEAAFGRQQCAYLAAGHTVAEAIAALLAQYKVTEYQAACSLKTPHGSTAHPTTGADPDDHPPPAEIGQRIA